MEGVLDRIIRGLSQDQETRRRDHLEEALQIDAFIEKVAKLKQLESPFTMVIDFYSAEYTLDYMQMHMQNILHILTVKFV